MVYVFDEARVIRLRRRVSSYRLDNRFQASSDRRRGGRPLAVGIPPIRLIRPPSRSPLVLLLAAFATSAVLTAPGIAVAGPPPTATVSLEQLTWTEVRDAVRAGKTSIIIPVGGTEQSGPYIALGKHNRRVEILSERIARALGDALVAPVIAYVPEGSIAPPSEHMRFPGTISVPPDVFERTIDAAAESFRAHGFRDVVLLGDHGGYQSNLSAVAGRLNRRWASTPARAHYIAEYYRAGGGHADLADTSLTLAIDPSMVRLDRLRSAPRPDPSDGVYGDDPRSATAERGRAAADAQVAAAVRAIRLATTRHGRRPR